MVLLTHITKDLFQSYTNDFWNCLRHNSLNNSIKKIIVFSNIKIQNTLNIDKVSFVYRENLTQDVLYDYQRGPVLIKTDPFVKFYSDLKNISVLELTEWMIEGDGYQIFSNNTKKSIIERCHKIKNSELYTQRKKVISPKKSDSKKIEISNDENSIVKLDKTNKKLDVIIISVDYNDYLIITLPKNLEIFENITVITTPEDEMCQKICKKFRVPYITTNVMYESGSKFNKGKTADFAIKMLDDPGYVLLLDADIIINKKIDTSLLKRDVLYTTDRFIIENLDKYKAYLKNREHFLKNQTVNVDERGIGFFQLFHMSSECINSELIYPTDSEDASWTDLKFRDKFSKRENLELEAIHLGPAYTNWSGRNSEKFLPESDLLELLYKKSTYTICSFYFNYRDDHRQKNNFIKFLQQWNGHYHNMVVGLVDYSDLDFEIPCRKVIIPGDKNKKVWSKELIINQIVKQIETDYVLWIDGDIIYQNLDWLNNLDSIIENFDFVQLFEKINYLDEWGEITNVYKSIATSGLSDVDQLMSNGCRPGGAWLSRTRTLKLKPLFDEMSVGGGDTILAYAMLGNLSGRTLNKVKESNKSIYNRAIDWISRFGTKKISYLPESVNHLYHGDIIDRKYDERYLGLKNKNTYKIVIFTENIGNYDNLRPISEYENTRCVAFVDEDIEVKGWEIVNVNNLEQIKNLKNTKLICKYIRTHSQELLPEHDYSLHIDANMILTTDPNKILEEIVDKTHSIMAFNHYKRETIYDEAKQCIEWKLDNANKISKQVDRYRKDGIVGKLYECGFLLRKNNNQIQNFDKIWWNEILQNSHRDQISFPYVIEKTGVEIKSFKHTNRMKSDYVRVDEIKRGITHKGSRIFNNNIIMLYEDSREKWGSTKMRGFDIANKIKCDIIPLSQSSKIKYKKVVVLKLSSYKKIIKLTEYNEVIIDMVDFNQHIHDLSIFKEFDYGIFTSTEQLVKLSGIFKYPEKCKVIYHHWDERFRNIEVDYRESVNVCYFGQPEKCYKFNNFTDISYHTIDWYDFDDKLKLYKDYNVHFGVKPQEEEEKIQPSTKISTASAIGCPIIVNKSNQNTELLGLEYPYYCEPDDNSVYRTLLKIKSEFETDNWFLAKRILEKIKEETSIDTVSKKYLDL